MASRVEPEKPVLPESSCTSNLEGQLGWRLKCGVFQEDLNSVWGVSCEEYFDSNLDLANRDVGRPKQMTRRCKSFKANLWLCDDYPLSLRKQVLPIIDMMAATNLHFAKLRDFIGLHLPSGFPVKIGMAGALYVDRWTGISCTCIELDY